MSTETVISFTTHHYEDHELRLLDITVEAFTTDLRLTDEQRGRIARYLYDRFGSA